MERCIFIRAKSRTEGGWAPEKTVVVSMDAVGLTCCRGPSVPVSTRDAKCALRSPQKRKGGRGGRAGWNERCVGWGGQRDWGENCFGGGGSPILPGFERMGLLFASIFLPI